MAALSRDAITKICSAAGFTGNALPIAVAIVFAESGGNPNSHNGQGKDDSYGLFQINMIGSLGPDRRKKYHLAQDSDLYDPATNARVAHAIYVDQGFKPWTTYTSGAYKNHLSDTGGSGSDSTVVSNAVTPAATGVTGGLNALGATLFKGVANIGGIAVAVVLLILGVVLLMHNALPISKVAKTVGKVVNS